MVGSTVDENVDERQNEEKLTISRTITPAQGGRLEAVQAAVASATDIR